jgi:hypothetical protein
MVEPCWRDPRFARYFRGARGFVYSLLHRDPYAGGQRPSTPEDRVLQGLELRRIEAGPNVAGESVKRPSVHPLDQPDPHLHDDVRAGAAGDGEVSTLGDAYPIGDVTNFRRRSTVALHKRGSVPRTST